MVLKIHPGNTRATDGMNGVVEKVLARTRENLEAGRLTLADARLVYQTLMDYETLPGESRDRIKQARAGL